MFAVPSGTNGRHSSQQAEAVAGIPATIKTKSFLAMVTDPTAPRLGIGPAHVARPMWVFTARITNPGPGLDDRPVGRGPYIPYPPGTVFNDIWLVDDLTLTPAGRFACPGWESNLPARP